LSRLSKVDIPRYILEAEGHLAGSINPNGLIGSRALVEMRQRICKKPVFLISNLLH
jgi:hypothetical protein